MSRWPDGRRSLAAGRGGVVEAEALWPRLNRYVPVRPTPKQAAFLLLPHREAFYGGAAGGGKSTALLASALQYVDVPGYSALLVRSSYMELQQPNGLIDMAKAWLGPTDAGWRSADYTWRFPSGATLTFRYLQGPNAELTFQGGQYQFIGVDEVTELDEDAYRFLFSRLRAPAGSPIPLRMRAASNPHGPGLEWVYRRFILEGRPAGRIYIPAVFEDNPHLDLVSYDENLRELPPVIRERLRYGDWSARPDAGLFKRSWFEGRFIEQHQLPVNLMLCRFWDLAATEASAGSDPDHSAGVLLGRDRDGMCYVIDVVRTRSTPLGVQRLVKQTAEADRALARYRDWKPPLVRMEQEPGSAGKALVDAYSRLVLPAFDFRGVSSTGSKETRAGPLSAQAEAGHVLICRGPWNTEFLDELCAFPRGRHDDQVDALSGAYGTLVDPAAWRDRARMKPMIIADGSAPRRRRSRSRDPLHPPPPRERKAR
jgi:predicted phage terminase large subunit-like protein